MPFELMPSVEQKIEKLINDGVREKNSTTEHVGDIEKEIIRCVYAVI